MNSGYSQVNKNEYISYDDNNNMYHIKCNEDITDILLLEDELEELNNEIKNLDEEINQIERSINDKKYSNRVLKIASLIIFIVGLGFGISLSPALLMSLGVFSFFELFFISTFGSDSENRKEKCKLIMDRSRAIIKANDLDKKLANKQNQVMYIKRNMKDSIENKYPTVSLCEEKNVVKKLEKKIR